MPDWVHRTTKDYLVSVPTNELPDPPASNYIEQPDLSAVVGQPSYYWIITGNVVSLADAPGRAVIDAQRLSDQRDSTAGDMDRVEFYVRAFALVVMDEFNAVADKLNEITATVDSVNNLGQFKTAMQAINDRPQRTIAQLKTAVRNKLGT